MKIYVMIVNDDDFRYDTINDAVVLAENEEQAIYFAKQSRDVKWDIEQVIKIDNPKLIAAYLYRG